MRPLDPVPFEKVVAAARAHIAEERARLAALDEDGQIVALPLPAEPDNAPR